MHINEEDTPTEQMNPGIRRTVQWLRDNGFRTVDSGDGETREHACDRPVGYVVIRVDPPMLAAEAERLMALCSSRGVDLAASYDAMMTAWEQGRPDEELQRFPNLEASFHPVDGVATLDLVNVTDAVLFPAN